MFETFRTAIAIIVVFVLALLTPAVAGAQNMSDLDTNEIAGYVLTDATLAKYIMTPGRHGTRVTSDGRFPASRTP